MTVTQASVNGAPQAAPPQTEPPQTAPPRTEPPRTEPPRTAADMLATAKALAPMLRERAPEIERAQCVPADLVETLRAAGIYRMCVPRDRGGPGLNSMEQLEVVEALSYGDASAGWCAMIGSLSGLYVPFLHPAAVEELYPNPDVITVGMLHPLGRAERVPGGYRLFGRWTFGSGIHHCDWVISGAWVYRDGKPYAEEGSKHDHDSREFLVPRSQVEVIDNWNPTGLAGSGSCDYTITDVFVPDEHTLDFGTVRGRPGPLAQPEVFQRSLCGVPLGVARAAIDYFLEVAPPRVERITGVAWRDNEHVQITLGQCIADLVATRGGVYRSLERQWEVLEAGGTLDDLAPVERAALPMSWAHAFWTARSIVSRLYDLLQTWSILQSSPMDRWLRDTTVMCQHLAAQEVIFQTGGAYLMGGRPKYRLSLGII
jgi:indole-3-acetate monooxygenase